MLGASRENSTRIMIGDIKEEDDSFKLKDSKLEYNPDFGSNDQSIKSSIMSQDHSINGRGDSETSENIDNSMSNNKVDDVQNTRLEDNQVNKKNMSPFKINESVK